MVSPINQALMGAALTMLVTAPALAAAVTGAGSFSRDDEVHWIAFNTHTTGTVTIETFGYAGGTDASGTPVAAGGFDPVFALFGSDGTLLGYGDDGASRADPVTGASLDALLDIVLDAGRYLVAISQFDNFAIGPDRLGGFLQAGNASFTAAYGCGAGQFCDISGASRSASYSLSVSGSTVPEPASLGLAGLALAGLAWSRTRRRQ